MERKMSEQSSANNIPPAKAVVNFSAVPMTHPLIHSLSDVNVSLGSEFEQRMAALQQVYMQQRQTLMIQFNQSQTQLAVQHFHYMQQLIHEYNVQKQLQEQQEQKEAAAAEERLQESASCTSVYNNQHASEIPRKISMPTSQSLYSMASGPNELLTSTSSGTISNKTKERLLAVLNKRKHNRQQLQSVGSSPDDQCLSDEYSLRKASSEPNLKMRTALRVKLQNRSSPKSPQQVTYGKASHHTIGPYPQPLTSASILRQCHSGNLGKDQFDRYSSDEVLMDIANSSSFHNEGLGGKTGSLQRLHSQQKSFARPGSTSPTPCQQGPGAEGNAHGHQIFKPQPLYSSPSLPDMSSASVMRQMQKSLSMAAAAQAMERSSTTASLLSTTNPNADILNQLAALNDPTILKSLSGILPVQMQPGDAVRGAAGLSGVSVSSGLAFVNPAAYYGSAVGLASRPDLLGSAAFRPLDRRADPSALAGAHSGLSVQFSPLLLSAAAKVDPSSVIAASNNQTTNPPSSSTLKDQLRNLIIRRKSVVREEPEEEVMDAGPSLPASESASNSSPELFGRSMSMSSCGSLKASSGDIRELSNRRFPAPESRKRTVEDEAPAEHRPAKLAETIDLAEDNCSALDHCDKPQRAGAGAGQSLITGIAYDTLMCKHQCLCNDNKRHLEHSGRIQSIWARLQETGLINRCERLQARKAGIDCLKLVHTSIYANFFGTTAASRAKLSPAELPVKSFTRLPCGGVGVDTDTYFNDHSTSLAARMAVGCAIELCVAIMEGRIRNGFAIVRPPGSHAEPQQALGFCYFNSVAIAAKYLLQQRFAACAGSESSSEITPENGTGNQHLQRILILDWDVHHGNGTQLVFYDNPNVLYLSIHRHDGGNFFPGSGSIAESGSGAGSGYNINIAFNGGPMGDTEYLAAWRCVIDPVLAEFSPEFILVSAGFDATSGHPPALGGYQVTHAFFGFATQQLCKYASGRVAMVLEGGYDLASVCDCTAECVRVLCGEEPSPLAEPSLTRLPNKDAVDTLRSVISTHANRWKRLQPELIDVCQKDFDAATQARNKFAALSVAGRQENSSVGADCASVDTALDSATIAKVPSSSPVAVAAVAPTSSVIEVDAMAVPDSQQATSEEMDQS